MKIKETWGLLKEAFSNFLSDNVSRLGAALAYYTIFSLAPLLIIVTGIASFFFGEKAVHGQLYSEINGLVGSEGSALIESMVASAHKSPHGVLSAVIGVAFLLIGASGVISQLKDALNEIWKVPPKEGGGILLYIRTRFLSIAVVLGFGFLFIVSLIISSVLAVWQKRAHDYIPGPIIVAQISDFVVSTGINAVLFALLFKFLPDLPLSWKNVWRGGLVTAILFVIGKTLIGLYLGSLGAASSYGAAGSALVVLLWIYYSSQIFLFGAEYTKVYSGKKTGGKIPVPG